MRQLTDADFAGAVDERSGLVLVGFSTGWCAPCRLLAPVLERLAQDYAGKLTVAQVDVEANPVTRDKNNVKSVPYLVLFNQGKRVTAWLGYHNREELQRELAAYIS